MKTIQMLLGLAAFLMAGSTMPVVHHQVTRAVDGDLLYAKPDRTLNKASVVDGDLLYAKPVRRQNTREVDGDLLYNKPDRIEHPTI